MMPAPERSFMRAAKSGVGFFCLGVFLLVQTMAAIPAFHAWVHHDAREPEHECAVTLFLNGQVHSVSTDVAVVQRQPVTVFQAPAHGVDFVSADVRLLHSRGPPV
jgi:hypothetical protein